MWPPCPETTNSAARKNYTFRLKVHHMDQFAERCSQSKLSMASVVEELGLSRQAVNRRRNSKKVQSIIQAELQTSADEIQLLRKKSIRHLSLLMDHPDPRISLSAARTVFTVCGVAEVAGYGEKAIRQSAVFTTSWGSGRG
jgi:hypothetical protein